MSELFHKYSGKSEEWPNDARGFEKLEADIHRPSLCEVLGSGPHALSEGETPTPELIRRHSQYQPGYTITGERKQLGRRVKLVIFLLCLLAACVYTAVYDEPLGAPVSYGVEKP